ncbi:glutaminyl-tRNA synthetase [Nematocida sp. LUAm3]|nr:glutaminyl-tRNA synthetase [Nematocida sp. LUAm3]KAI5173521.1 glutaminyl-tRNA synthetase [Nematocida sp. LUAm2]KAI5176742.1 glutaminyl-tRNA synthetase [Nematocida sp. LUAm1]
MSENTQQEKYLEHLGIHPQKVKELLKNKRIRSVASALEEETKEIKEFSSEKKKLLYKVLENASSPTTAKKYNILIDKKVITSEIDLKNAYSILEKNPDADIPQVQLLMQQNVPKPDELVEVAEQVIQENIEEKRVKILKELKHHPRLLYVEPKTLLELLDTLSIKKTEKKEIVKGLSPEKIKELLELSTQQNPPTRTINRMYYDAAADEEKRASKDKKWLRYQEGEMLQMHTPFTNYQNHPNLLINHIKRTNGQVRVRFPPEPNGHLHIGHAKAMSINFGYKEFFNGWISLRYDDTNPKAEKLIFYEKIKEMVYWMGYSPSSITYASDYFDKLYESAVDLIKRGKAYVCHQTKEETENKKKTAMSNKISNTKEDLCISPWRDRAVEENLKEFEKMKNGHYNEGQAVLRMKMDMSSDNPQLWDLVAYRVIKHPHARTGTKWIIYPSYDFTHCLTDSFEDITHSFCTTEFINSRASYNWLCDALEVYRPVQWEYSRLSLTGALLSKRYITKAIEDKKFSGWDDPRLSTLEGLRSRGVPNYSIRRFVESLGITTVSSEMPMHLFDSVVREDLKESPKYTAVLTPLRAFVNGRPVLIDQKDYRSTREEDFFRVQEGNTVLMKEIGAVKVTHHDPLTLGESQAKHIGVVPWLPVSAPSCELEVTHPDTATITRYHGNVSYEASKVPVGGYVQFIRMGYFVRVENEGLCFRMVVPLKNTQLL